MAILRVALLALVTIILGLLAGVAPSYTVVVFADEHAIVRLGSVEGGDLELGGPFGRMTVPKDRRLDVEVRGGGTLELESLTLSSGARLRARRIKVRGEVQLARVELAAEEMLVIESGASLAARDVDLRGRVVLSTGTVRGGRTVAIAGENVMNQGAISCPGGDVNVSFGTYYTESRRGRIDVSSHQGGTVRIEGAKRSRIFTSGEHRASGARGGRISLSASDVHLAAATLDVSGTASGGHIDIGDEAAGTRGVAIRPGTTLLADSAHQRGLVDVWASRDIAFAGRVVAERIVIDPKNITVGEPGDLFWDELVDPTPSAGDSFGDQVFVLETGNILVTDALDDFAASNAGAVHLYSGVDGALLATLTGSSANDTVGDAYPMSNGNYLVVAETWANAGQANAGAVTFGDGTTGVAGVVSATNSLVGSTAEDRVGSAHTLLANGNYVVQSEFWANGAEADAGAATWGSGSVGIAGTVSAVNSLVGTMPADRVGNKTVALPNGNYLVQSANWRNGSLTIAGAVTWADGTTGIVGTISAANSLVGGSAFDNVGTSVKVLTNGNYVVLSPFWDNAVTDDVGAATWGDGATGVFGPVSNSNSLVGSSSDDGLDLRVTALSDGDYAVGNPTWDGAQSNVGAATWGDGTTGITGTISPANSLVGSSAGDRIGATITALTNGNYVVRSESWDNVGAANAGAATWSDGTVVGPVSVANSLVGTTASDGVGQSIALLANGNYVVLSGFWRNAGLANAGAATWADGTVGVTGAVSAANSLVGTQAGDSVGARITTLTNGNYVITSELWQNGGISDAGAVTWGDGSVGVSGTVSVSNSLVGTTVDDEVGHDVVALANGNYVVFTANWDNGAIANVGAVTWGNGTTGITGVVSTANSLVGTTASDHVGLVSPLANGNYVVRSLNWDNGGIIDAGASTWVDGSTGLTGPVSTANSLVGTGPNNNVGDLITELENGNYVVQSSGWDGANINVGAATWVDGTSGLVGSVSASNSLVGSSAGDFVGIGIVPLPDGDYLVESPFWDDGVTTNAGAATRGNGEGGTTGPITNTNSLVSPVSGGGVNLFSMAGPSPSAFVASFQPGTFVALARGPDATQSTYAYEPGASMTISASAIADVLAQGTDVTLEASNDLLVAAALVVDNPGGDGGHLTLAAGRSIQLSESIDTDGGDLTLIANDVLASGVIDVDRDAGAGGIVWDDGITVAAGALQLEVRDGAGKTNTTSGALEIGETSAASVFAEVVGAGLIVKGDVSAAAAGDAIVLVTDASFEAEGGSALSAQSGRFLVYSPSPEATTPGTLSFSFVEYDKTYPSPPDAANTGDGILYASSPAADGAAVTLEQGADQADPTSGDTITFDIVFDRDVVGFEAGDVDLGESTADDNYYAEIAGGPASFTVIVRGMSTDGVVIASIPAGACTGALDGLPNQASVSADNEVTWESPDGDGAGSGDPEAETSEDGCSCRAAGASTTSPWALLALVALGLRGRPSTRDDDRKRHRVTLRAR